MRQVMLGMLALTLPCAAVAQTRSASRIVPPSPNAQWAEVPGNDQVRAFVDRGSIRLENGAVRYVGRMIYERPDEDGVLELVHLGEIRCARNDYRTIGFDMIGASGEVIASYLLDADDAPEPVSPESPNAGLHAEFCR